MMTHRFYLIFILFSLATVSIWLSLTKGSTSIPFDQLLFSEDKLFNTIFLQLRLPRTLAAFVTGGLLALAGSLMQLLLQNPLADPYVLGVSSGAALMTLLLMLVGIGEDWLGAGAWIGSLLTICLIFLFARKHFRQTHLLLLSGIAIAGGLSACISFILLLAPERNLHSMLFWLAGDLNDAHLPWVGIVILCIGLILCWLLAPGLNIFSRGEKEARALGLPIHQYRIVLFLLSSLFTATAVTIAGCIGFIGLVVPHLTRILIGYDQRILLPAAMLLGGSLLTLADTSARLLFAPQQLPVGILTAILGTPIFIWLLRR